MTRRAWYVLSNLFCKNTTPNALKVTWNAFKSRNFWHILSLLVIINELTMFVLVSLKK
jgi:hypothetical protein